MLARPILDRLAVAACCGLASMNLHVPPAAAAFDTLYSAKLYCVPGVTAERCRGTFWESGKLYKKGQEGGVLTTEEYVAALARIVELQKILQELVSQADAGATQTVGETAATARAELRILGSRVVRSGFLGDERIDAERRLGAVLAVLDDIDRDALQQKQQDLPAGFGSLGLQADFAARRLNEFTRSLPAQPDPDAF